MQLWLLATFTLKTPRIICRAWSLEVRGHIQHCLLQSYVWLYFLGRSTLPGLLLVFTGYASTQL